MKIRTIYWFEKANNILNSVAQAVFDLHRDSKISFKNIFDNGLF